MKVFVINLPRSADRKAHMEAQLERAGLNHEFIAATDGRSLTEEELERLVDPDLVRRAPRWFRPGQVGCCLSHLEVYRRVAAEDHDTAFVLEDDAVLPSGIESLLGAVAAELDRPEAALLYYTAKAPLRLSEQQAAQLAGGARLLYPLDLAPLNSTMGYVITRSACRRMADLVLPIKVGPDSWAYFHEQGALERVRCVYPRPIRARTDFKSTMDYSGGVAGGAKVTAAISERRVFPLAQILAVRRAMTARKMSRFSVVPEPSPYVRP
jgi:glycosyl transferase family 25